ncbi:MAG TPA: hypothetical protein VEJ21_05600 [Acidimicrobiales bacterium]|nr:hypothetical protein [Acidimicrobiales bacterium]
MVRLSAGVMAVSAAVLCGYAGAAFGSAPAGTGRVVLAASIDGHALSRTGESRPLRLEPDRPATVTLAVTDNGTRPVTVSTVVLDGKVIGLTFFSYETSVALLVPAHSRDTLSYSLDLSALTGQATGLVPASLTLLGPSRNVLAGQTTTVDVRGSLISVYGLFGLAALVLTVLAVLGVLAAAAWHRLPANRLLRALRFVPAGVGVGLVLVFALSAFRVWAPSNGHSLVLVLVCLAVAFGVGFLSPTPLLPEEEAEEDEYLDLAPDNAPPGPALAGQET